MIKVTKAQVKAMIKKLGEAEVAMLPSKACPRSAWMSPTFVLFGEESVFERDIIAYAYYNCNSQLGYGVAFYVPQLQWNKYMEVRDEKTN